MSEELEIIARQDGTVEIAANVQGEANIEARMEQPTEIAVEVTAAGPPGPQGKQGNPGNAGVSPTIAVTDITGGHRVTITGADGSVSFDVMDGAGVPAGGSTGDFLRKHSDDDGDTEWDEFPSIKKGTHESGTSLIIGRLDDQTASGNYSVAVGRGNSVTGAGSVALGRQNNIAGNYSFATGYNNNVSGAQSAAVCQTNKATGSACFAEGYNNTSSGTATHAEGHTTTASGNQAHSEGYLTKATGGVSHAEGWDNEASGGASHVEGHANVANHSCQHVFGAYNVADPSEAATYEQGNYIEIVGNGTADDARSNARTLDWSGNEVLAGKLTLGAGPTGNMDAATKKYVDDNIPAVPEAATNAPEDLGTAAVGSSAKYAKEDHVHKMPSASDVGAAAKTWTKISGSSTSSSETLTYPAEATELLIKAKCTYGGGTNAYICNVPVAAISDISIIQVGGYYFGAADYGLCNVNHSAANRTIAFRNIRYAGTGATTGTVTVYWR